MTSYIIDKNIFKKYKFDYKFDYKLPYGTIELILASAISISVIVYINYV